MRLNSIISSQYSSGVSARSRTARVLAAAGVVHPDGNLAERLDGGGDKTLDGRPVEHIRGDSEAAATTRLNALDDAREVVLAASGYDHIGAGIGHGPGDALADARVLRR